MAERQELPPEMPENAEGIEDITWLRRHRVARLRGRGLSVWEIAREMATPGSEYYTLNPNTGKPYSPKYIRNDLTKIRRRYVKMVMNTLDQHRANQLADIHEVKRAAWAAGKLKVVLDAIGLEAKITGTIEVRHRLEVDMRLITEVVNTLKISGLDPAQVLQSLLEEARANVPQLPGGETVQGVLVKGDEVEEELLDDWQEAE